ncbi:MAG: SpoIVB peptidase [Eubacteriales bacterium]|nr:SpoIVB peptidase [Eubacteriales bacterium]
MRRRKAFWKASLAVLLSAAGIGAAAGWLYHTWEKIPDSIRIKAGIEQELTLNAPVTGEIYLEKDRLEEALPALGTSAEPSAGLAAGSSAGLAAQAQVIPVNLSRPVTVTASHTQEYTMDVKLFGVIPFKRVSVQVIPDQSLIPAGVPIGIYVRTDGILVIGQGEFEGLGNVTREPARHLLQAGDYILQADGEKVESKAAFTRLVSEANGRELVLTIRRDGQVFDVKVRPEQDRDGAYKLGIWIRDNAQGVGTMTYLKSDASFGALGHGINDADTAALMEVESGSLYRTEIIAVKKGQDGTPGELTGVIDYNLENRIGTIEINSVEGIFGTLSREKADSIQTAAMPVGLKQDVHLGEAQILCSVDGQTAPQLYTVQIRAVHLNHDNVNRGIELQVTDERLIRQTGGIVQGMSGSPILQDGKLVGAVTHVFVHDSTRGYGIFVETMLEHGA